MATTGESAHQHFLDTSRFGSLDGLRAAAVVGTVWHHTAAGPGILGAGWLGVDLFFVISGFLITTLLLRERDLYGRIDLGAFYMRRVLRIFPAYYLTVGIYVILAVTILSETTNAQRYMQLLPAFLTYTANWFYTPAPGVTLFVHGWSLSTEEQFYLLWPLLLILVLRGRRPLTGAAAAAAGLVVVEMGAPQLLEADFVRTVLSSLALPICGGASLAVALHAPRGFGVLAPVMSHRCSAPLVAVVTVAAIAGGARLELVQLGLVALVAACVIQEDNGLRLMLTWRPVTYLGEISYGVYLYHLFVVLVLASLGLGALPQTAFAALTLLVSAWVATLSRAFFERPFLRLKRRFDRSGAGSSSSIARGMGGSGRSTFGSFAAMT